MASIPSTTSPTTLQEIAARGRLASQQSETYEDARAACDEYLGQIQTGTPVELEVAAVTRRATAQSLTDESANAAQEIALTALAAGVSGPIGRTIAEIGAKVMEASSDHEDGRALAAPFLQSIVGTSRNPVEVAVARTAYEATSSTVTDESAYNAQLASLKMIQDGVPQEHGKALAELGARILQHATDFEDERTMSAPLLKGLVAYGTPAERVLAETADQVHQAYLGDATAAASARLVFDTIKLQALGSHEELLTHYGEKLMHEAEDSQDEATVGEIVLRALVAQSSEEGVRSLAAAGEAKSQEADNYEDAVDAVRGAFSGITELSKTVSGLQLPTPGADAPPQEAMPLLETRITATRAEMARLSAEVRAAESLVADADTRITLVAQQIGPLEVQTTTAMNLVRRTTLVGLGGMFGSIGGVVTFFSGHPLIGTAVLVGGMATLLVNRSVRDRALEQARTAQFLAQPLYEQYDQARFDKDGATDSLAPKRAALRSLEGTLQKDQGTLDVLRMACVRKPDEQARVEVGQAEVTLGGVRVPRK